MNRDGDTVNDYGSDFSDADAEADRDVQFIYCVDLTEETLVRLRSNDPSLDGLRIKTYSYENRSIKGLGLAIAKSTCLKRLELVIECVNPLVVELSQ